MALGFGRKKAAGDAPATPVSVATEVAPMEVAPVQAAPVPSHAPSSPSADELDAFDLDSFAALPLAETPAPQTPAPQTSAAGMSAPDDAASAFDFPPVPPTQITTQVTMAGATQSGAAGVDTPDFDNLYEIEQANAARTVGPDVRPAPFVPPSATIQEPAAPFYEPQVPVGEVEVIAPKKKFPLVPALGALAILGAGGLVASMMRPAPEADETAPVVTRVRARPAPPVAATAANTIRNVPVPAKEAPALEIVPVKPVPIKPGTARSATVPKIVITTGAGAVRPGIAPATEQMTQLKALWNQGANAKHRGDYASARRYWTQGLKMQPTNVGFKQSIAKLKK